MRLVDQSHVKGLLASFANVCIRIEYQCLISYLIITYPSLLHLLGADTILQDLILANYTYPSGMDIQITINYMRQLPIFSLLFSF